MSSSSGTIAARRQRPLSRRSLALELAASQPTTSRSAEREISTTTGWGLLKQPDNQKTASSIAPGPPDFWINFRPARRIRRNLGGLRGRFWNSINRNRRCLLNFYRSGEGLY